MKQQCSTIWLRLESSCGLILEEHSKYIGYMDYSDKGFAHHFQMNNQTNRIWRCLFTVSSRKDLTSSQMNQMNQISQMT